MISRTATHTLKALAALQQLPVGSFAGAEQLAHQIHAPSNYLGKLLQQISRAGIVEGRKGRKGGFRLAGEGQTFSLFHALDPIEHFDRYNGCLLGRAKCLRASPCPLHKGWARIRQQYLDFLKSTTLSDLSEKRDIE